MIQKPNTIRIQKWDGSEYYLKLKSQHTAMEFQLTLIELKYLAGYINEVVGTEETDIVKELEINKP